MKSGSAGSYAAATLCSVALHGLLLVALIVGWTPAEKPRQPVKPKYIEAKLMELKPKATPKPQADTTAQRKAREAETKRKREAENRRKQEAEARRKELARKETERKRKEEAARKERELQAKRKREEQERKRQEEERRRKLESEFASALEDEEEFLASASDQELAASYSGYIEDRIVANWSRPPSARRGMEVELLIQLVPTGRIVSVSVVKSSGNAAFDRSAEQAVHKVGQFDRLRELDSRVFESNFRQFRLVFRPEDLRL